MCGHRFMLDVAQHCDRKSSSVVDAIILTLNADAMLRLEAGEGHPYSSRCFT